MKTLVAFLLAYGPEIAAAVVLAIGLAGAYLLLTAARVIFRSTRDHDRDTEQAARPHVPEGGAHRYPSGANVGRNPGSSGATALRPAEMVDATAGRDRHFDEEAR